MRYSDNYVDHYTATSTFEPMDQLAAQQQSQASAVIATGNDLAADATGLALRLGRLVDKIIGSEPQGEGTGKTDPASGYFIDEIRHAQLNQRHAIERLSYELSRLERAFE